MRAVMFRIKRTFADILLKASAIKRRHVYLPGSKVKIVVVIITEEETDRAVTTLQRWDDATQGHYLLPTGRVGIDKEAKQWSFRDAITQKLAPIPIGAYQLHPNIKAQIKIELKSGPTERDPKEIDRVYDEDNQTVELEFN